MIEKEDVIRGLVVGIMVLISGFMMMWFFYNTLDYPKDLPGLFYYKAATWGDCLCLPMISGLLTVFASKNSPERELANNHITRAIVLLSVIIGIFIQASWLWRENTVLNWSLPYTHCFNLAGWWHSLFFISMFGLLSYLLVLFCQIVKLKDSRIDDQDVLLWNGALLFGECYLLIHFHDNYSSRISRPFIYAAVVISSFLACMLLLLLIKSKETKIKLAKGIAVALFFALGLAGIICEKL